MNTPLKIAIRGAGVTGLWQALTLARRGHSVILAEQSAEPFTNACSPFAGAMLANRCEEENAALRYGRPSTLAPAPKGALSLRRRGIANSSIVSSA